MAPGRTAGVGFVERLASTAEQLEDQDTARLVIAFQSGDGAAFTALYQRYFDRVYGYLRVLLNDTHRAEDVAQQVFMQVFEALPAYERRAAPFRAWLFTVVRNAALMVVRKKESDLLEPAEIDRRLEASADDGTDLSMLDWITDRDLTMFVERLPIAQRQVLLLRYLLDLPGAEIARVLERSPEDVRILQHRALRFLEKRLSAVGRGPGRLKRATGIRECPRQAIVLRSRRFALLR
ncbi:MAG: hypothetical protein QOJ38_465 [Solirubrobacterales bacterium]|nr:hypothetical protein [Solirubrobacterales bacterium]